MISPASKTPKRQVRWPYLGIFLGSLPFFFPINKNFYIHCFCCEDRNLFLKERYCLVAGDKHKQMRATEFEVAIIIVHGYNGENACILKREKQNILIKEILIKMRTGVIALAFLTLAVLVNHTGLTKTQPTQYGQVWLRSPHAQLWSLKG